MYQLKNGILYQDGNPVIAMGQSYYPSFHEAKYPAPPSGDRIGLMKEDIRLMREVGFNFLRVAAIGDVKLEDGKIAVHTPFVDEMLKEADEKGMATSVRLQGYVMNLHGYDDYLMRNEKDEPMHLDWSAFMQSSMFHKGIVKDNLDMTRALAAHFAAIPGVLSYQIYNEPHYPYNGTFDYHPATLAAYQEWRKAKGLAPEEAPRRKPVGGESPEPWIQWRLFSLYAMDKFLNDSAAAAKEAAPEKETYTCITASPIASNAMSAGISYFDNAKGMDQVGITSYGNMEGADFYIPACQFDMTESAAALNGKHAWIIEIDARTHMPARKGPEETYTLLGTGFKGIVYYEWRGDYADEKTPLPDNCGFIFNDGSRTEHYERSVEAVRFVNRYSKWFAAAEKMRSGVAVLYSEHAIAFADAWNQGGQGVKTQMTKNHVTQQMHQTYRELRNCQVTVDFVRAENLKENRFGTRVLLIPCSRDWLEEDEAALIDAFEAAGGKAYYLQSRGGMIENPPFGWWRWNVERLNSVTAEFRSRLETADVLEQEGIRPTVRTDSRHLKTGLLRGDGYTVAVFTNTDPAGKHVKGAVMRTELAYRKARFISLDTDTELTEKDGIIPLPEINEGGAVIFED